jgi:hypothetical protein
MVRSGDGGPGRGRAAGVSEGSRAAGLVPEGVLDFGPGLLEVALGLVSAAFGAQAPAAGEPAGGLLEGAFDCWALCAIFLEIFMGAAFRESFRGRGRTGRDIGGGLAGR